MIKYLLCGLLFAFFMNSCSTKPIIVTKVTKIQKKSYEIIRQKKAFIDNINPFLVHKMSKNTTSNYINLPTLSKNMLFIIPADDFDRIHYIINKENDKLNIKSHLIDGIEYFYNSVDKEILLVYNLPFSYFLKNNVVFHLNIVGSFNHELVKKDILFDFTYNFMEQAKYFNEDTNNPSFKFTSATSKEVSPYIKNIIREESKRINIKKFSKSYQKLYTKVVGK